MRRSGRHQNIVKDVPQATTTTTAHQTFVDAPKIGKLIMRLSRTLFEPNRVALRLDQF
jgi:hypothetical protein